MEPQIPIEPSEVKVTVTLVLNASFSWSEKPNRNLLTFYVISCVILVSLALAALLLNVLLLLTIVSSSNLKRLALNKLLCVVSMTSFADCLLNVPFSLYLMKASSMGTKMCTLNSVSVLLVSMATTWGVCGMCFERLVSTWKRKRSKCASFTSVVIGTPLLTAIAIILPLLTGLAEVRVYPNRLSCFIATDKELRYRTFILACLCCPVCVGLVSLLTSLTLNFRNIKSINRVDLSYAELFFEESHLWVEWQNTKFVGCIVLLYSAFQIPFIMKEIQYVPTSDKLTQQQNATTGLPLVITTPAGDRAYTWIKYFFCLLFPLTTLILRKDIRRKLTSMTSFCRPNASIVSKEDSTSSKVTSPRDSCDDFQIPRGWRRRRLSSVTSLTTPIVFGRPEGSVGKFQMLDISTGISRWKEIYCDSRTLGKKQGGNKTIFDDPIEDGEEEFTELVSYEDGTEEEINSFEELESLTTFKEVAIQTSDTSFGQHSQMNSYVEDTYKAMEKKRRKPSRFQSKSFSDHRTDRSVLPRSKNYLTYPKLSPNSRYLMQLRCNPSTSDLMKALKAYRSQKYTAACDIIPRGTGELMDTSLGEAREIVSL